MDLKQYSVCIPLIYNDGTEVEGDKLYQTVREIAEKFKGMTIVTQTPLVFPNVKGIWESPGVRYLDNIWILLICVEDTEENRKFFLNLKTKLKERFRQEEIFVTAQSVEIL